MLPTIPMAVALREGVAVAFLGRGFRRGDRRWSRAEPRMLGKAATVSVILALVAALMPWGSFAHALFLGGEITTIAVLPDRCDPTALRARQKPTLHRDRAQ